MKIKINTNIIKRLKPCKDRLDNWLLHYKAFEGDLVEFLDLPNISYTDKIWVSVRVMPRFLVEVFAIDCAFKAYAAYASAAAYSAAADPADATFVASYAADVAAATYASSAATYASAVAAYAADYAASSAAYASRPALADLRKQLQIESLIYLIQGAK